MRPRSLPIKALLLRTFLPAVVVVAVLLAVFVYNWLYASILEGFERKLVTTSALAGAMVDPADHDALIAVAFEGGDAQAAEASTAYRRNVEPMQRIRKELGLTYLYTQVNGGPADILYILDASTGEDHSPLGSSDDLPDETAEGLRRVEDTGSIYVSPIEYQEQWGLLKTGAAPVRGAGGRIAASAGADVNVSVIQVATQNALFMSAMIGVGSVLACLLVSLALVRRIAGPIEALTEETLQVAAGRGHSAAQGSAPREVTVLRKALLERAAEISCELQARRERGVQEDARAHAGLLASGSGIGPGQPVILLSGARRVIAWTPGDPADARTVLAQRAMARLAQAMAENSALCADWAMLADCDQGACLVVDGTAGWVEWIGTPQAGLRVAGRHADPGRFDPKERVSFVSLTGGEFVVWPGEAR